MKRYFRIMIPVLLLCLPIGLRAQQAAPFPDFTFKRVKPPPPGAAPRITVQIAPPSATAPSAPVPSSPRKAPAEDYAWFWEGVSPSLQAAGPGRLERAVRQLAMAPAGSAPPVPRLQDLQDIAARHGAVLLLSTVGTRVSPAFALAAMAVESGGRPEAVSKAGARGVMQLLPATAARFGAEDPLDAAQNIRAGVAYLDWLMQEFGGDPVLVLAAYNAGENAVRRYDGVPPFAETRAYVPRVLAAWTVARGLCITPPELISDGCVFAVREVRNEER